MNIVDPRTVRPDELKSGDVMIVTVVCYIDKWDDQPNHIEVMVEKQALEGVLIPVCQELDVRFTANKGYSSQSHMYRIGARIYNKINAGKKVWVIYLGDHDPSGLDMDRDIVERLEMFSGHSIELVRLALKMEQIEELQPPENPAKMTDPRADFYIAQYGDSSWELDAVEPAELARLVTDFVEDLRDQEIWEQSLELEDEMKGELKEFADRWEE